MNKRTRLISFLIILSYILTACQQEPERTKSKNQGDISSSADGITIQLEKEQYTTENTEAKLTLSNESVTTFLYGQKYLLEKNVNGTWYEISLREGIAFSEEGYYLAPNQSESEMILLDIFDEKLSPGRYRIIKDFSNTEKEYSSENEILIAASFELIEP